MRSRRTTLILLAVVVLLTGAISAANRDRRTATTSTATTTTAPATPATTSGAPSADVVARLPSSKPVRARTGETVVLNVRSETPDIAKILAVGVSTSVGPGIPGELRFIAPSPGDLPVDLQVAGTTAGIVRVSAPEG